MVKSKKSDFSKNRNPKGFSKKGAKAKKINASTAYDTCSEQLSAFGGVLPLIKFFDLVGFREIFDFANKAPAREPKLGHYWFRISERAIMSHFLSCKNNK